MKLSASLGFLWAELSLPDAIHRAKAAGFDAVECHWPYDEDLSTVERALQETGLPMLGLNTRRGDLSQGEMGLAALTGRQGEAEAATEEAMRYAFEIGAQAVHVMAGNAAGPDAHRVFVQNLRFAARIAARHGIMILIEPLNRHDAPHYFLRTTDQARAVIDEVAADNLKLMFDCYHVGRTEGDVTTRLRALLPYIGHIQIAAVPDRGAPDHGELHYPTVFAAITDLGWDRPIGAEYKPGGPTDPTLGWMAERRGTR